MTTPQTDQDGLDELRQSLTRFVLREAGQAVARDPSLPLSAELVTAIREEAERAAERARASIPSSEALAREVINVVTPQLISIAQDVAQGRPPRTSRGLAGISGAPQWVVWLIAAFAAVLFMGVGFAAARLIDIAGQAGPPAAAEAAPAQTDGIDNEASPSLHDPLGSNGAASSSSQTTLGQTPSVSEPPSS